jgi:ubiquinone/menaquinone biosynthesis C-methylase UbiE
MNELHKHTYQEKETWKNHLEELINATNGPLIEIGGPTPNQWATDSAYNLIDTNTLTKKIITTNITSGVDVWDYSDETGEEEKVDFLPVDIQADALRLPFKSSSVGAIFASALPVEIRVGALQEAVRVLETGGLLIWQHGIEQDRKNAEELRLTVLIDKTNRIENHDYVFRKE